MTLKDREQAAVVGSEIIELSPVDEPVPMPFLEPDAPEVTDEVSVAPNWKLVWWRFKKHRLAMLSAVLLIGIIVIALVPEFFAVQDPNATEALRAFIPPQPLKLMQDGRFAPHVNGVQGVRNPTTLRLEYQIDPEVQVPIQLFSRGFEYKALGFIPTTLHLLGPQEGASIESIHVLGTDRLGRDQWSRLMYGTRVSMSIGLVAVAVSTFLGILLGGISGYFGGLVDTIIQRLIELLQSLPAIPIWLALTAALPKDWTVEKTYFAITVILALIGWTALAREVRGRFLTLRDEDFVIAARLVGASELRVIFRHMVPTFLSHIIATTTLAIPVMIINETFLSFLGLGLRPPAISWGVLLQEAQNLQSIALAPWLLIPGIAVIITVLVLNILGDGLRDAADPYS